jgi:hypothetical protein
LFRPFASPPSNTYDERWRWEQFDNALDHLNELIAGVMTVSRNLELRTVGRRDLPPLVLGFGWDLMADGERSPVAWQTYVPHDRIADVGHELTAEEATFAAWIANTRGDPFKDSRSFLLAAWSAAQQGRFTHAIADSGTAVEVLVSAALRVAAPIKGYDSAKLDNILAGSFASRVKDHFAPTFAYDRDPLTSSDPLGAWWQAGYLLRNQVVHRGLRPTEPQTVTALEASEALHLDLADRWSNDPRLAPLLGRIPDYVISEAAQAGAGPVPRYFER